MVLELFRRTEERPLQVRGREIDAAPIGVGLVVVQSVSARANDTAINDDGFEIKLRRRFAISQAILEMFQDLELGRVERGFETIGEPDQVFFSGHRRRPGYHTHRATRMHERIARSADFHERHDLCPGKNVIRLVRHRGSEDTEAQDESEAEQPCPQLSIAILRISSLRTS